jgi:DNA-binding transcriptional MerR regulator
VVKTLLVDGNNLVKIGELARRFSVLPSTIHFYTQEGLLKADSVSKGGYRLYDLDKALSRLQKIVWLQSKKHLTIGEIKKLL